MSKGREASAVRVPKEGRRNGKEAFGQSSGMS